MNKIKNHLLSILAFICLVSFSTVQAKEVLRVLTWPGYADPGFVKLFEGRFDVEVHISYVVSDDELWSRIKENDGNNFDVFAVNTAELQRYINKGLSIPLNAENIPNHHNQLPRFRDLSSIPGLIRDGKTYAIPYTYSEMGLIYNRKLVKNPPVSMEAMWDKAYQGKVLAFNTSNHNFSIAGLLLGARNPFHLNKDELNKAIDKLIALRRNVLTFYNSPEEAVELYKENEIALVFGNYGDQQVKQLQAIGADIGYVLPEEGALAWLDCWSITSGVKNKKLAEAWIDFTLEKSVSGALTERQGLQNTITAVSDNRNKDKIIWLEPIADYAQREGAWGKIRSGYTRNNF